MGDSLDIILLTKSAKIKKYCVAGIDALTGRWVRLVTSDEQSHGALEGRDMFLQGGGTAQVLDKVRVPVIGPQPGAHQPENVLINTAKPWEKLGAATIDELLCLHQPETPKYIMGGKLFFQTEDWLPKHSLSLVSVTGLKVYLNSKDKMKCSFTYNNWDYKSISMTDPDYYYVKKEEDIGSALIVVSIPDMPYEDKYYKFVAKIFPF